MTSENSDSPSRPCKENQKYYTLKISQNQEQPAPNNPSQVDSDLDSVSEGESELDSNYSEDEFDSDDGMASGDENDFHTHFHTHSHAHSYTHTPRLKQVSMNRNVNKQILKHLTVDETDWTDCSSTASVRPRRRKNHIAYNPFPKLEVTIPSVMNVRPTSSLLSALIERSNLKSARMNHGLSSMNKISSIHSNSTSNSNPNSPSKLKPNSNSNSYRLSCLGLRRPPHTFNISTMANTVTNTSLLCPKHPIYENVGIFDFRQAELTDSLRRGLIDDHRLLGGLGKREGQPYLCKGIDGCGW